MFLCPYHISHFYHSSVRATSTIYIMEINRHSFSGKQLHLSSCKCHSTFPTCHTFREEQWLAHWQAWGNGPFGCHFLTIDTAPVDLVEVVPISKESLYFKKPWVAELRWCFNKFSRKHLKKKKQLTKTKKKQNLPLHSIPPNWKNKKKYVSSPPLDPSTQVAQGPPHGAVNPTGPLPIRKKNAPRENGPPEAGSHAKCHERDHAPPVADTFQGVRRWTGSHFATLLRNPALANKFPLERNQCWRLRPLFSSLQLSIWSCAAQTVQRAKRG